MEMKEFEFLCPNKIIFTHHLSKSLKEAKAYLHVNKAFIVTDPGIASMPMFENLKKAMYESDFEYEAFTESELNPTDVSITKAADALLKTDCDVVIGFGGGSSLDTAKGAAIIKTNGGKIRDYFGVDKVEITPMPKIAIPTTAGSGADITKFIAIIDSVKMTKAQICDQGVAPDVSIIYPETLIGIPRRLIPAVGFDALTHSIEGYINAKANAITKPLSLRAFELMSQNLVRFYNDNTDLEAASALLLATSLGCMACSSIGTGDTHCIARSVGGRFEQIHHGTALAVVLPHVLNFNIEVRTREMADLAATMGLEIAGKTGMEAAQMLVLAVQKMRDDMGLPNNYKELGMTTDCLEELAEASKYKSENGSSAGAPPRKATIEEYRQLIMDAYNGRKITY